LVLADDYDTILSEWSGNDHREKGVDHGGQGNDLWESGLTVHRQGPWGLRQQGGLPRCEAWRQEARRDAEILQGTAERSGDRRRGKGHYWLWRFL